MFYTNGANLIEDTTKSYIIQSLQQCHENRVQIYRIILNILVACVFIGFFGIGIYVCYTRRLTPEEKYNRMKRDQEYVLSKIRDYQIQKMRQHESLTNLPNTYIPETRAWKL